MSIEKYEGRYISLCDGPGCDKSLPGEITFASALGLMRSEGWRSQVVDDEWRHFCPSCNRKRRQEEKPEE